MATSAASESENAPAQPKLGGDFLEGLSNLNLLRQVGLMITLAASVAIGFAIVMWMQGEDYRPLYGRMDNLDAANVVDVLEQNQIKFKVDENSGAILVASEDVHMARLKLAEFGLPSSPTQGFELMDKEQPLGTSQFVENTRYQRSIEGELARTITSITSIRNARVHLAIPKKTVFVRDVTNPTASVFVEVFAGRSVEPAQVKAIMNLVASSVPGMKMADVTVVDQHGNLISTGEDSADLLMAAKQHQYSKEVENSVIKRINGILEPVVGGGKFRAEVSADIDFTAVEQAAETFNPDLPAIRSEQTLNETRRAGDVAAGIPGALTNQPPGTAEAPEQIDPATGQPVAAAQPTNNREQATRNYELDRTVSYTKHQQGTLKRLTVAVVVDDKVVKNADGTETMVPWTENELERLSILVRDAVGFSAVRGDSVNVLNSAFANRVEDPSVMVDVPWWEQWIIPNIKYIASVLVILLIIFGLLRPMFKSLSKQGGALAEQEEARQLAALEAAGAGGLDGMSDETVTLTGGSALLLPSPEEGYEAQLNAIKGLIADDPGRVAQVVKQWINRDD
ncbi:MULTISPECIES: flagellar basal-body MS-ring/collar protein FliF [Cellvibrio]|uniref:Flagellar M-ring protein n=1 Tax=Cellvibrio fibrivorans TaxID=126350 RepID=A0ABU1UWC7_9GAMM|nr:flagellar basal-body MS-ring/collar protein FliF [Cellvibrio fibrivorans]MDR7089493.1 flagellar M-ring protein FliF [Cellvibrio fibrivorans]